MYSRYLHQTRGILRSLRRHFQRITTVCISGPSCSKLTMKLVNASLKLWSLNMAYMLILLLKKVSSFCICKSYSHFFSKSTCELEIVFTRTVNILTTYELVKLTMLWTTGPWIFPFLTVPSGHTTLKWRRINVDATWSRRIDVDTTSFWCCLPAGFILKNRCAYK